MPTPLDCSQPSNLLLGSALKYQEQRQHPRIKPPKSVVVAWQSGIHRDVCYVENLSLGGLYILTKKKIPLRSPVQILLDMPVGQVRGRAVVRRLADHGMGIQIIAMDPGDRARLRQQLRELPPST